MVEVRGKEKREKHWKSIDLLLSAILGKPNDGKG